MRGAEALALNERRSLGANPPDFVKQYVNYGASLRAGQFLILGAKARALINGRYNVSVEDIQNEIEVALAGRAVTFTVEKRDRFPVRIRFSRQRDPRWTHKTGHRWTPENRP